MVSASNSSVQPIPFHWQFFAGAVAGVTETIAMYPLDVVKTRFQIQVERHYKSIVDCIRKIISNEGPRTLYRGMLAPILVEAPKRAVKFTANDLFSNLYMKMFGKSKVDQPLSVITGMSTGATEALVVVSFDLVKIRMQDKQNAGKYKNTMDCILTIFKEEGFGAFFKGLGVTICRHAAWNGGYFGVIHSIRSVLQDSESNRQHTLLQNLIAGTVGGTVGTILNTPFDVIKTRIQNQVYAQSGHTVKTKYSGIWNSLNLVVREEGFSALYKGFVPKVLRLGPGGGVLLVVFDGVSSLIKKHVL